MEDKNIIDVEFEEDKEVRYINGKPIYWTTKDVADLLGENDSTIRYWCDCFKDVIKIRRSGRNRRFTDLNIEQLKDIQRLLRQDNLSIEQAIEYCSIKEVSVLEQKVKDKDPIAIQILTSNLISKISEQMNDMKINIIEEMIDKMNANFEYQNELHHQHREEIKDFVAVTIQNEIQNNIESQMEVFKSQIDDKEQEATKRDIEMLNMLKSHMEERKELQFQLEQEKKKGFWNKWNIWFKK